MCIGSSSSKWTVDSKTNLGLKSSRTAMEPSSTVKISTNVRFCVRGGRGSRYELGKRVERRGSSRVDRTDPSDTTSDRWPRGTMLANGVLLIHDEHSHLLSLLSCRFLVGCPS